MGWGGIENPETLELYIFPGADNIFDLYEDDGETTGYQHGKYALTKMEQTWGGDELTLTISPATGATELLPGERRYILNFRGVAQPREFSITRNSSPLNLESTYQADTETFTLPPILLTSNDRLIVTLQGDLPAARAHARKAGEVSR